MEFVIEKNDLGLLGIRDKESDTKLIITATLPKYQAGLTPEQANLIAQAPKLYEACKRVLNEAQTLPKLNAWQIQYSIIKQIAQAIASVEEK